MNMKIRSLLLVALLLAPVTALAQTAASSATPASNAPHLKAGELDQLVAPIALYPDTLLSEVLMASTYPIEVVEAERWLNANKELKGDQLKDAVDKQGWDASVKSLLATPSVLDMMSSKIDWTQKLGRAVVDQQADVMDAVQRLRAKAQANNKLQSTAQQNVVVRQEQGRQLIAVEPNDPNTMYVPYYDPGVVYGDWPYPEYPPYYWPAPGYIAAGVIATGIAFGAGYALGRWASGGYWGGNINWNNNNISIGGGGNWNRGAHVEHRLGNRGGRQHGLNLGNRGAGNLGNRGGAGNRGHVAHRGGNRGAGAGNRGSRGGHVAHRGGGRQRAAARGGGRGHGVRAGGGTRAHGGGHRSGGMRGGGGGRGGGRRSDTMLKHDIVLLGYLENGLGFYRFSYNGSGKAYVGVLAQEVQRVMPEAVVRGDDGYLRVYYHRLGLQFESYDAWLRSGGSIPSLSRMRYRANE
ncbi:MAG: DUF3300 domain-containing protein [Hyphomicrobiales bacterium]|nr:DUF3300 domain-containing protein [Hyphomicrobiales bacterium]